MAVAVRNEVRFLLNDEVVSLSDLPATRTLLDTLRLDKRLTGSKEGCAEGDCGACTVLVGRLSGDGLVYETVNACIRFTGTLDGCHVVTIEHLKGKNGGLHPVQQAMVDHHGSQCGFCTPGFVMSLYALWMAHPNPLTDQVEVALQGNLCRCTGYAPIIRAAQDISAAPDTDPLVSERKAVVAQLNSLADGARVECGPDDDRLIIPAHVDDLAEILEASPNATVVAGSTDVGLWVTKFMRDISPVVFIGELADLRTAEVSDRGLTLGAGVSYTDAYPLITEHFPQLDAFWLRIGGQQVRNMGTVGGNIANGSPIGDTPPPLIALGAEITLRKGQSRRTIKLQDYFIAYGKQDRAEGEFVESVFIPFLPEGEHFAAYKISKRRDEDISAVCAAFRIKVADGAIASATIAYGGMAATPKRAAKAEAALIGKAWNQDSVSAAMAALAEDYQPITDMRASAEYRMLSAQNLLQRFFLESGGEAVQLTRGVA